MWVIEGVCYLQTNFVFQKCLVFCLEGMSHYYLWLCTRISGKWYPSINHIIKQVLQSLNGDQKSLHKRCKLETKAYSQKKSCLYLRDKMAIKANGLISGYCVIKIAILLRLSSVLCEGRLWFTARNFIRMTKICPASGHEHRLAWSVIIMHN